MKGSDRKILLVSYLGHPKQGIGARRWYKLSKYLSKNSTVDLLTSNFSKSVMELSQYENVFYYKTKYNKYLTGESNSFIDKVRYRLGMYFFNNILSRNPFDKSFKDHKVFTQQFLKICNNYDWVIVTGAPFELCYQTVVLCNQKNINCWVDLRDPWTTGEAYGMNLLNKKAFLNQEKKEEFTVENATVFSVPNSVMKVQFVKKYPKIREKIIVLEHGYDADDFKAIESKNEYSIGDKIKFIYGGTVYDGVVPKLQVWIESLNKLKVDFEFNIYALNYEKLLNTPLSSFAQVNIHSPIDSYLLNKKIAESTIYVAFYPDRYKDFVSTKFIEIAVTKTPILLVAKEGEISEFLKTNQLGIQLENPDDRNINWSDLVRQISSLNSTLNFESYSFEHISTSILKKMLEFS